MHLINLLAELCVFWTKLLDAGHFFFIKAPGQLSQTGIAKNEGGYKASERDEKAEKLVHWAMRVNGLSHLTSLSLAIVNPLLSLEIPEFS